MRDFKRQQPLRAAFSDGAATGKLQAGIRIHRQHNYPSDIGCLLCLPELMHRVGNGGICSPVQAQVVLAGQFSGKLTERNVVSSQEGLKGAKVVYVSGSASRPLCGTESL